MTQFDTVVAQLREERDKTKAQLHRLDQAIAALSGLTKPSLAGKGRTRRPLSPAARKRIAAAQKRRWARARASTGSKPARARRALSAAARARIVAAQRARWAKYRRQQKAARA